jgi:hypothetical protein
MAVYAGIYLGVDGIWFIDLPDAVGDAQALCVAPGELPYLLRGAPQGAEVSGAFAKFGLGPGDAHRHDLVVAPPQVPRARPPGNGLDDELDGLESSGVLLVVQGSHANQPFAVALDEFLGAARPR